MKEEAEIMNDFLDRAKRESDPFLPPDSCCPELLITEVTSIGAPPNGSYTMGAQTWNGRPLYKQSTGANFLYFDSGGNYCFGPDASLPCATHEVFVQHYFKISGINLIFIA